MISASYVYLSSVALAVLMGSAIVGRHHVSAAETPPLPRIAQSQYAGSKRCAECHQMHYDGWKSSAHNKMIRPAIFEGPNKTVVADFNTPSPNRPFEAKDVRR